MTGAGDRLEGLGGWVLWQGLASLEKAGGQGVGTLNGFKG